MRPGGIQDRIDARPAVNRASERVLCRHPSPLPITIDDEPAKVEVQSPSESLLASNGLLKRHGLFSPHPSVWLADFERAKHYARDGQILALSIGGIVPPTDRKDQLLPDYQTSPQ